MAKGIAGVKKHAAVAVKKPLTKEVDAKATNTTKPGTHTPPKGLN